MRTKYTLLIAFVVIFLAANRSAAEMYRWEDKDGKIHVADDIFDVPQEYLPQIKTYKETRAASEYGDIPLRKTDSGYVVKARINGVEDVNLILDTGATKTVIAPVALKRAGAKTSKDKPVTLRTAGGELKAAVAELESIHLEGWRRGPLTVVSHDAIQGYDGLLGMDFLGAYRFEIMTYGPKLRLNLP